MKYSARTLLTSAALVLALAGCKKVLDSAKVEEVIKDGLKAQVGQAPKSMDCPKDVPLKVTSSFECKGKSDDGLDLVVTVTVMDDAGMVKWKLTQIGDQTAPKEPKAPDHKAEPAAAAHEDKADDKPTEDDKAPQ